MTLLTPLHGSTKYAPIAELIGTVPNGDGATNGYGSAVKLTEHYAFVSSPLAKPTGVTSAGVVYVYKKLSHGYDVANPQIIELPGPSHHLGLEKIDYQRGWLFLSCIGTPVQEQTPPIAQGDFKGAVLIYRLIDDTWTLVQQIDSTTIPALADLAPINPVINPFVSPYEFQQGASFGLDFAVDVKCGLMIVGAENQSTDPNSVNQGRAYTFRLHNDTWVYESTLSNPDGLITNDGFGAQVAMRGDLALISNGIVFQGPRVGNSAVYVYKYKNHQWNFVQKVIGTQPPTSSTTLLWALIPSFSVQVGDTFGSALALSDKWAVIGAAYENLGGTTSKGAVYFYKVDPSKARPLTFSQKLIANDTNTATQVFALTSVAIDGSTAVVSNVTATQGTQEFAGGANVYKLTGNTWQYVTTLFDPLSITQPAAFFGGAVDIRGNTIIVGGGAQGLSSALLIGTPPLLGNPDVPSIPDLLRAVIYKECQ